MTNELQQAISNGEFLFHYQPRVDLSTGTVTGAEALLRIGDGTATVDHSGDKVARSHWDMLLERRTLPELEELLEERLAYVRARRGVGEEVARDKISA